MSMSVSQARELFQSLSAESVPIDTGPVVNRVFKKIALKHHPDKCTDAGKKSERTELMKQINSAKDVLDAYYANKSKDSAPVGRDQSHEPQTDVGEEDGSMSGAEDVSDNDSDCYEEDDEAGPQHGNHYYWSGFGFGNASHRHNKAAGTGWRDANYTKSSDEENSTLFADFLFRFTPSGVLKTRDEYAAEIPLKDLPTKWTTQPMSEYCQQFLPHLLEEMRTELQETLHTVLDAPDLKSMRARTEDSTFVDLRLSEKEIFPVQGNDSGTRLWMLNIGKGITVDSDLRAGDFVLLIPKAHAKFPLGDHVLTRAIPGFMVRKKRMYMSETISFRLRSELRSEDDTRRASYAYVAVRLMKLFLTQMLHDRLASGFREAAHIKPGIEDALRGKQDCRNDMCEESQYDVGPQHHGSALPKITRERWRLLKEMERPGLDMNSSQKNVLEHATRLQSGALAVIGPPGTGKTTTLVEVIANQITLHRDNSVSLPNEDPGPPQVGVFATTNRAVHELCVRFVRKKVFDHMKNTEQEVTLFPQIKVVMLRSFRLRLSEVEDAETLERVDLSSREQRIARWAHCVRDRMTKLQSVFHDPIGALRDRYERLLADLKINAPPKSGNEHSEQEMQTLLGHKDLRPFKAGSSKLFEILWDTMIVPEVKEIMSVTASVRGDFHEKQQIRVPILKACQNLYLRLSDTQESLFSLKSADSTTEVFSTAMNELKDGLQATFRAWKVGENFTTDDPLVLKMAFEKSCGAHATIGIQRGAGEQQCQRCKVEADKIHRTIIGTSDALRHALLRETDVVFSTYTMPIFRHYAISLSLTTAIFDEAGQLSRAHLAAVIQPTWERLILAGDHKQLPAVVKSRRVKETGFGVSLLEQMSGPNGLGDRSQHVLLLDTQYRMDPVIAGFPSSQFYDRLLHNGESIRSRLNIFRNEHWATMRKTVSGTTTRSYSVLVFHDTSHLPLYPRERDANFRFDPKFYPKNKESGELFRSSDVRHPVSKSYYNEMEAFLVREDLEALIKKAEGVASSTNELLVKAMPKKLTVAVIAPYAEQQSLLKQELGHLLSNDLVDISIGTVDAFQGSEADLVCVSCVRANKAGGIGHVANPNRANVALTRAKLACWIYGHKATLTKSEGVWSDFLRSYAAHEDSAIVVENTADRFRLKCAGSSGGTSRDNIGSQRDTFAAFVTRDRVVSAKKRMDHGSFVNEEDGSVNVSSLYGSASIDDLLDLTFDRGLWKVLLREKMKNTLAGLRETKSVIVSMVINMLGSGELFPDEDRGGRSGPLLLGSGDVDYATWLIQSTPLAGDKGRNTQAFLLWYVHLLQKDDDKDRFEQVIVVHDLVKYGAEEAARAELAKQLQSGQGRAFLKSCCHRDRRPCERGGKLRVVHPMEFDASEVLKISEGNMDSDGSLCTSSLLRVQSAFTQEERKLYTASGTTRLAQIIAQQRIDVEVPIMLSPQQEELRKDAEWKLSIVGGRSGSGKTEILISVGYGFVRVFDRCRAKTELEENPDEGCNVPAVLVTQSLSLQQSLQTRAEKLESFMALTPPDSFESWTRDQQRTWIESALDSESQIGQTSTRARCADNADGRAFREPPRNFNAEIGPEQLKRLHVFTVRQLLQMLDRTLKGTPFFKPEDGTDDELGGQKDRNGEINFVRFEKHIWPQIVKKVKGRASLNSLSVFQEILDIKGHIFAGEEGSSPLRIRAKSEEKYVAGSLTRKNRLFEDDKTRKTFYLYFREYQAALREEEWDVCDLCQNLYDRYLQYGYHGRHVDKFLSDESQDLLLCEMLAFTILTPSENSFLWAYDMAQTIQEGRKFKVEDLKTLLYYRYNRKESHLGMVDFSEKNDTKRKEELSQNLRPKFLTENFRTHDGVLRVASLLCVDMLKVVFPQQIDCNMPREESRDAGEAPRLVYGVEDEEFARILFHEGSRGRETSTASILGESRELGPNQAIVIYSENQRAAVHKFFKHADGRKVPNVFTPQQIKGLQFKSVLVWKWFSSAPQHNCWHLLEAALKEMLSCSGRGNQGGQGDYYGYRPLENMRSKLTESELDVWCRELKLLYVTVTRPQAQLLFFEGMCDERVWNNLSHIRSVLVDAPRSGLLRSRGEVPSSGTSYAQFATAGKSTRRETSGEDDLLVFVSGDNLNSTQGFSRYVTDVKLRDSSFVKQFAVLSSSAEEFRKKGMEFFAHHRWSDAEQMFRKAGKANLANLCVARAEQTLSDEDLQGRSGYEKVDASKRLLHALALYRQLLGIPQDDLLLRRTTPKLCGFDDEEKSQLNLPQDLYLPAVKCFLSLGLNVEAGAAYATFLHDPKKAAELYEKSLHSAQTKLQDARKKVEEKNTKSDVVVVNKKNNTNQQQAVLASRQHSSREITELGYEVALLKRKAGLAYARVASEELQMQSQFDEEVGEPLASAEYTTRKKKLYKEAQRYFADAIRLLWGEYETLVNLGDKPDPMFIVTTLEPFREQMDSDLTLISKRDGRNFLKSEKEFPKADDLSRWPIFDRIGHIARQEINREWATRVEKRNMKQGVIKAELSALRAKLQRVVRAEEEPSLQKEAREVHIGTDTAGGTGSATQSARGANGKKKKKTSKQGTKPSTTSACSSGAATRIKQMERLKLEKDIEKNEIALSELPTDQAMRTQVASTDPKSKELLLKIADMIRDPFDAIDFLDYYAGLGLVAKLYFCSNKTKPHAQSSTTSALSLLSKYAGYDLCSMLNFARNAAEATGQWSDSATLLTQLISKTHENTPENQKLKDLQRTHCRCEKVLMPERDGALLVIEQDSWVETAEFPRSIADFENKFRKRTLKPQPGILMARLAREFVAHQKFTLSALSDVEISAEVADVAAINRCVLEEPSTSSAFFMHEIKNDFSARSNCYLVFKQWLGYLTLGYTALGQDNGDAGPDRHSGSGQDRAQRKRESKRFEYCLRELLSHAGDEAAETEFVAHHCRDLREHVTLRYHWKPQSMQPIVLSTEDYRAHAQECYRTIGKTICDAFQRVFLRYLLVSFDARVTRLHRTSDTGEAKAEEVPTPSAETNCTAVIGWCLTEVQGFLRWGEQHLSLYAKDFSCRPTFEGLAGQARLFLYTSFVAQWEGTRLTCDLLEQSQSVKKQHALLARILDSLIAQDEPPKSTAEGELLQLWWLQSNLLTAGDVAGDFCGGFLQRAPRELLWRERKSRSSTSAGGKSDSGSYKDLDVGQMLEGILEREEDLTCSINNIVHELDGEQTVFHDDMKEKLRHVAEQVGVLLHDGYANALLRLSHTSEHFLCLVHLVVRSLQHASCFLFDGTVSASGQSSASLFCAAQLAEKLLLQTQRNTEALIHDIELLQANILKLRMFYAKVTKEVESCEAAFLQGEKHLTALKAMRQELLTRRTSAKGTTRTEPTEVGATNAVAEVKEAAKNGKGVKGSKTKAAPGKNGRTGGSSKKSAEGDDEKKLQAKIDAVTKNVEKAEAAFAAKECKLRSTIAEVFAVWARDWEDHADAQPEEQTEVISSGLDLETLRSRIVEILAAASKRIDAAEENLQSKESFLKGEQGVSVTFDTMRSKARQLKGMILKVVVPKMLTTADNTQKHPSPGEALRERETAGVDSLLQHQNIYSELLNHIGSKHAIQYMRRVFATCADLAF
ncbi:unnamed protein product [Amoebophrya sp. A25]|nr:unnamed protein product [Amoebophrya sp. A25]|eukprot:GSA25T00013931001.1